MIHDRQDAREAAAKTSGFARTRLSRLSQTVLAAVLLSLLLAGPAHARCKYYEICAGDETYDAANTEQQNQSWVINAAGLAGKKSSYNSIIALFKRTTAFFSEMMDKSQDKYTDNLEAEMAVNQLNAEASLRQTNAQIWDNTHDEVAAMAGRTAMNSGVPAGGADQFLCNVIKTRQGIPAMQEFSRMLARIVAVGIDATYVLGQGGPKYWVDDMLMRCGKVQGFALKSGNALDAIPAECRAPVSLPELSTADRDVSALSLSRDQVYTVPPVKEVEHTQNGITQKVLMFVPESDDASTKESMQRWMQASQYCYLVAGFRPPPPRGKGQLSPKGVAKNDKIAECRARQALFTTNCTYRLARLTRPNCDDPAMKAFCITAQEACQAAADAQLDLGPAYRSCKNGLSLEQLENVSVQLCGSTRKIQSSILGGASEAEKLLSLTRCAKAKSQWQDKQDREDAIFQQSVEAMHDIQRCFEEADRM